MASHTARYQKETGEKLLDGTAEEKLQGRRKGYSGGKLGALRENKGPANRIIAPSSPKENMKMGGAHFRQTQAG